MHHIWKGGSPDNGFPVDKPHASHTCFGGIGSAPVYGGWPYTNSLMAVGLSVVSSSARRVLSWRRRASLILTFWRPFEIASCNMENCPWLPGMPATRLRSSPMSRSQSFRLADLKCTSSSICSRAFSRWCSAMRSSFVLPLKSHPRKRLVSCSAASPFSNLLMEMGSFLLGLSSRLSSYRLDLAGLHCVPTLPSHHESLSFHSSHAITKRCAIFIPC